MRTNYTPPFNKLSPHFIMNKSRKEQLSTYNFLQLTDRNGHLLQIQFHCCKANDIIVRLHTENLSLYFVKYSPYRKAFHKKVVHLSNTCILCCAPTFLVSREALSVQWIGYRLCNQRIGVQFQAGTAISLGTIRPLEHLGGQPSLLFNGCRGLFPQG
jgi:hypothetical protein